MAKDNELIIPLPNGGTLRCGEGRKYQWGGYLRICDKRGRELLYWDVREWEAEGEGESVIGAAFVAALKPVSKVKVPVHPGKKTSTVNVIEMADGSVVGLASYPDTPEGIKEAEQRFKDVANENTGYGMKAIEESIDDGILEDGTYSVLLVHSTV